ncbi:MAG: KH domain-containing protein [Actinomycetota bacterium]|nr:KH domain-containing protein [Actinomycetota bacterium]
MSSTGESSVEPGTVGSADADTDESWGPDAGRAGAVLGYLARQIVDDPDGVSIETSEARHGGTKLSLRVSGDDMGKVIGRRGRVAQAIRGVVRAAGARDGVDVTVDIVD